MSKPRMTLGKAWKNLGSDTDGELVLFTQDIAFFTGVSHPRTA